MRQLSLYEAFAIDRQPPPPPPPPPPPRRSASPIQSDGDQASSSNSSVCYICYEPTTETCQCACKPTVHADCLLKHVRISRRRTCSICHGPIANLRVRQRRRFYRSLTVLMYFAGVFIGIAAVAAMLSVAEAAVEPDLEKFYRFLLRSVGCVMEAIGASKLFTWLLERREREAEFTEYDYVQGATSLASAIRFF